MKNRLAILLLLCCAHMAAQRNVSALMPMPRHITQKSAQSFVMSEKTVIFIDHPSLRFAANELKQILFEQTNLLLPFEEESLGKKQTAIVLKTDASMANREQYSIDVEARRITITGASREAVYYGVLTFHQILLGDTPNTANNTVSGIFIADQPRYAHRALMIDPARNFIPVDDVKYFIRLMSRYKFNKLQLHLSDDQGWRAEIKKHSELTQFPGNKSFYTQTQLRDLVAYAAERNVEIIPEIDVPGHTVAMLIAHPELGCTNTDTVKKTLGKTLDMMLCASNPNVYKILDDIIQELAGIFPSKYIHLGGDEAVVEKNWAQCNHCKKLMQDKGYMKASQLMNVFFGNVLSSVAKAGKSPILWCELDNIHAPANEFLFPYPQDATLVSWRGGLTPTVIELTGKSGNPVILAPGEYAYLDYPQLQGDLPEFNNWGMPTTTLEKCYEFNPNYESATELAHIQGIMGTLWAEAMPDINRVTYMAFPRALALSEAGWSTMENRNWDSFAKRLYPNLLYLAKRGVSIRIPFEISKEKL